MNWLKDNLITLLVVALLLALGANTWNWWRKNVYYNALNISATKRVQDARAAERTMARELSALEDRLTRNRDDRNDDLTTQLADAGRPPPERVVYRLQDRWLPVSCPTGAASVDRHEANGGLQRADEEFLVRESARADDAVDQLNACIDAYALAREAALNFQR